MPTQPSPEGRGWPAAGVLTSRSGPGEGSLLKKVNTSSVLQPVNAGNSDSTIGAGSAKLYFGIRVKWLGGILILDEEASRARMCLAPQSVLQAGGKANTPFGGIAWP